MQSETRIWASWLLVTAALLGAPAARAEKSLTDGVDEIANRLATSYGDAKRGKVAIVPLRELTGGENVLGAYIADTMTNSFFNAGYRDIVERQMLDRAIQELKLSFTGMIDSESVKKLGKFLHADMVVAGTMTDLTSEVSVSCRMFNVETGQIAAVAQTRITKDENVRTMMGQKLGSTVGANPSPGPHKPAEPEPEPQGEVQIVEEIAFRLFGCVRNGETVTCDLTATAQSKDRYLCCFESTKIVDRKGRVFGSSQMSFGGKSGISVCTDIARAVPLAGQFVFEGIPAEDSNAVLLELFCNFKVQYRNVAFQ